MTPKYQPGDDVRPLIVHARRRFGGHTMLDIECPWCRTTQTSDLSRLERGARCEGEGCGAMLTERRAWRK